MNEASRDSGKISLTAGDVIAGKYRVEGPIGEGRTAVVYQATNLRLDERVALKMLKKGLRADPEMASRFTREAHALAKLRSEHVARALDVEELADGTSIMVMEYLDGDNLETVLHNGGPLSLQQSADFMIQACEGLCDAHARGIVHRDVKPENIVLVKRDGWLTVNLLDFGISKAALSPTASAIRTQSLMGSPVYMSPEQLRSTQDADVRSDVWSMGAVFYELLTGHTVYEYEGRSLTELISTILEQPPRRLNEFRPDLPADVQTIIDRCLEKDRSKRYQNTVELAVDLLPYAPSRSRAVVEKALNTATAAGLLKEAIRTPLSVRPPAGADQDLRRTLPAPEEPDAQPAQAARRSRKARVFVWVLLLAAAGAGGWIYRKRLPRLLAAPAPAPPVTQEIARQPEPAVPPSPPSLPLPSVAPPQGTQPEPPPSAASARAPARAVPIRARSPSHRSALDESTSASAGSEIAEPQPSPAPPPPPAVQEPAPPTTPAAAAPAIPAPVAGPKPGTMDAQGVAAVVRAHSGEFRSCFDQARMFNQDLRGRVTVQASVAPDGSATGASIASSTAHDSRLEACIVSTFGRLKFPAPAGGVAGSVTKTFNFE